MSALWLHHNEVIFTGKAVLTADMVLNVEGVVPLWLARWECGAEDSNMVIFVSFNDSSYTFEGLLTSSKLYIAFQNNIICIKSCFIKL